MECPFQTLGIRADSPASEVLKAWRRLMVKHHPDQSGSLDDAKAKELNGAKEKCLAEIIRRDYTVSEGEFVRHICTIIERSLANNCDLHLDLSEGSLIRPNLHKFMWFRSVDAMDWTLQCGMGHADFDQAIEDEIPILCRYYNDFIGEAGQTDHDRTMMSVLNKYDQIKGSGCGNFARFLTPPASENGAQ